MGGVGGRGGEIGREWEGFVGGVGIQQVLLLLVGWSAGFGVGWVRVGWGRGTSCRCRAFDFEPGGITPGRVFAVEALDGSMAGKNALDGWPALGLIGFLRVV